MSSMINIEQGENMIKSFKSFCAEDKDHDLGVAKAIKRTLDKGRQVKINDSPITKADWAKDQSNPERTSEPKQEPVHQKSRKQSSKAMQHQPSIIRHQDSTPEAGARVGST